MIHELGFSWRPSGGVDPTSAPVSVTADGEHNFDVPLAANAIDTQVAIAVDVSKIKSLFILSDKDAKIETNSNTGSGGNTITLSAGKPCVWYTGCGLTNPLSTDVTTAYLTNLNTTEAATVKIRILVNATP